MAFGGASNNYQYQGDYSEFDDDLGWNEFFLRSYDAQLGRFLQWDPYDQFASGYVGMGNDPANGTDPSGGFFGNGGGLGCAATKGMSGFGGFSSAMQAINVGGGVIPQMLGMISTVAQLANDIAGASRNSGVFGSNANAGNGSLNATDAGGADDNPCNCPPGYGSRPKPGGDKRPYFKTVDEAAVYWAWKHRNVGRGAFEVSSLIYAVQVSTTNKSVQSLYATTNAVAFPKQSNFERFFGIGNDPMSESPGIDDPIHEVLLNGWDKVGQIHLHPYDPKNTKGQGTGSDNGRFSDKDLSIRKTYPDKYWYVLGIYGQLSGHYPSKMPPLKNSSSFFYDPRENQIRYVEGSKGLNFYSPQTKPPDLCPCYKQ